MGSNQQQTDLPQETSPNHVPGNQHFSRDPLIALEGGGTAKKQLDSRLNSQSTIWFTGSLPKAATHTQQQLLSLT